MADKKLTVGDWMTKNPQTIDADASVIEAIHVLREKNVRRLPVMKAGKLAGLVTEKMLLGYMPAATTLDQWELQYILNKTPVTAAMNATPHTVRPDALLSEAAKLLRDRKLNGVIVVDDEGDLIGILTTTNALEALEHFAQMAAR
jgi:acetoin utilization protein AcuB